MSKRLEEGQIYPVGPEVISTSEIVVPKENFLYHVLNGQPEGNTTFKVIPADKQPAPVFTGKFFNANIGMLNKPLMLQLRFEPTPHGHIALLMTNERSVYDLERMGAELGRRVIQRGIDFDAVIAPDSLGSRLAQEVARARHNRDTWVTSFQKGKPRIEIIEGEKKIVVGAPKPWIPEDAGIEVSSGTSKEGATQKIFLDPKIVDAYKRHGRKVLIVDDACMTRGTLNSGIELARRMGLDVVALATVLNENQPVDSLHGIPFTWLTKLPLFDKVGEDIYMPQPGTYERLDNFFVQK